MRRNSSTSLTRRDWLRNIGAGIAAFSAAQALPTVSVLAQTTESPIPVDSNHVVLLSDIHIGHWDRYLFANDFLKKSVAEIVAMNPRPAHVLIYGDLAFDTGQTQDYRILRDLLSPLDKAGISWTGAMGNHDRRENFAEVFPEHAARSLFDGRMVFRVETPFVDFLLLDSLIQHEDPKQVIVPGEIRDDQKEWLHETLKASTKPVIVGAHHPLEETKLTELLKSHPCVAGYINGHRHYWISNQQSFTPSLILPSNGFWGDIGVVNARFSSKAAEFTLTMRDYIPPGKVATDEAPEKQEKISEKQGAKWTLELG